MIVGVGAEIDLRATLAPLKIAVNGWVTRYHVK